MRLSLLPEIITVVNTWLQVVRNCSIPLGILTDIFTPDNFLWYEYYSSFILQIGKFKPGHKKNKQWNQDWNPCLGLQRLVLDLSSSVNTSGLTFTCDTWPCDTACIFPAGLLLGQGRSPAPSCPPSSVAESPFSPWPQSLPWWLGLLYPLSRKFPVLLAAHFHLPWTCGAGPGGGAGNRCCCPGRAGKIIFPLLFKVLDWEISLS